MKKFSVSAFYEHMKPSYEAHQKCIVEACVPELAAFRGLKEIRSRPAIKRRHIQTTVLTITEISDSKKAEQPTDGGGDG